MNKINLVQSLNLWNIGSCSGVEDDLSGRDHFGSNPEPKSLFVTALKARMTRQELRIFASLKSLSKGDPGLHQDSLGALEHGGKVDLDRRNLQAKFAAAARKLGNTRGSDDCFGRSAAEIYTRPAEVFPFGKRNTFSFFC